ncbi:ABC transporter ATP-binding protein [Burkholderia cenocepacia]|nr:ABC transporter ATP-binding protein [Burkholderia cenocepacia]RQZ83544.1 ABC transporter ATP-binding protein [Burkholderia cenocepacia]RRA04050.1 ABC transporter ATP-binding protein [Burkholderia cenocepacia]
MSQSLLQIKNLRVAFSGVPIVKGIDIELRPGETLGIIGESGSGKSVTALALSHLLPFNAQRTADSFRFDGQDMNVADEKMVNGLRGSGWAMIFQDPVGAFNPVKRIDWHLKHVMARAAASGRCTANQDAVELLSAVGIKTPDRVLSSYPSQLSGGMLQRVLIAMVAAMRPKMIIADEPTTNLDKVIENQILDLLAQIQKQVGAAVILITHDLLVAQRTCNRIAVMYSGHLVETDTVDNIMNRPRHPYTRALLESSRSLVRGDERLKEIPLELKESLARDVKAIA